MTEKRSELIAEELGPDALAALRDRTGWEYKPDAVSTHDEGWAIPDDGPNGTEWRKVHYLSGYETVDGSLHHTIHYFEPDSEPELVDSCDVDDPGYEEWYKPLSFEKLQESWTAYAEYVARTGLDPLENYVIDRTHKEEWVAKLTQDEAGIAFVGAHRRSLASYVDRVSIKCPAALPEQVRVFLSLDRTGHVEGLHSLDELTDDSAFQLVRGDGFVLIKFSVDIPDHPDLIRNRLQVAAERHLGVTE